MAPSTTSELMRIFDDIFTNKVSYCTLCLRTEKERRLVHPHYLSMFVQSLNLPCGLQGSNNKVCYICETRAAGALRVRRAVSFAMGVDHLFHNMTVRRKNQATIRNQLAGTKASKDNLDKKAIEWERQLSEIRKQTQLLQTEVLVVDSIGVQMTVSEPEEARDEALAWPDGAPSALDHLLPEPEIEMDSIIILDEEEDPIDVKPTITSDPILNTHDSVTPKLVAIDNLLGSAPAHAPQGYVLHALVAGAAGQLAVPTLSAQIINGHLIYLTEPSNPTDITENVVFPIPIVGQSPPVENNRGSTAVHAADSLTTLDGMLDDILREKVDALQKNSKRTPEVEVRYIKKVKPSDVSKAVRQPGTRSDRIDWEDKIPMDVISFMDATDPNAAPTQGRGRGRGGARTGAGARGRGRGAQELISDIRSLEPQPRPPDVIDLC